LGREDVQAVPLNRPILTTQIIHRGYTAGGRSITAAINTNAGGQKLLRQSAMAFFLSNQAAQGGGCGWNIQTPIVGKLNELTSVWRDLSEVMRVTGLFADIITPSRKEPG
jgi:hypothetical protein